jgi:hypothetical protein
LCSRSSTRGSPRCLTPSSGPFLSISEPKAQSPKSKAQTSAT